MEFNVWKKQYDGYQNRIPLIDRTIHNEDDMFNKAVNGWDDYLLVGKSAIFTIYNALLPSRLNEVGSFLDFGCGHGRVARHLRFAFPCAKLFYSDIDDTAWQYCAAQYDGIGFSSEADFNNLIIPEKIDIIWLGSVFTHLNWGRSLALWRKLFDALKVNGIIVATFRGFESYNMMISNPERFNHGGYYDQMLNEYLNIGFGYQDYKGYKNWGQNLFSIQKIAELSQHTKNARLVNYSEAGWANIHDVAVWTKR